MRELNRSFSQDKYIIYTPEKFNREKYEALSESNHIKLYCNDEHFKIHEGGKNSVINLLYILIKTKKRYVLRKLFYYMNEFYGYILTFNNRYDSTITYKELNNRSCVRFSNAIKYFIKIDLPLLMN